MGLYIEKAVDGERHFTLRATAGNICGAIIAGERREGRIYPTAPPEYAARFGDGGLPGTHFQRLMPKSVEPKLLGPYLRNRLYEVMDEIIRENGI